MPPRRAILFDLDGTLVDSARTITDALTRLNRQRGGGAVDIGEVRSWVSLGVDRLVAHVLGSRSADTVADVAAFRTILASLKNEPSAVYADVADVVGTLRSDGLLLGVVTNKPERLATMLLAETGLAPLFDVIVGGDTATHAKPHPAPIVHALTMLDASTEHAIYIGDSDVDAAAAAAVPMPFVFFTGGYGPAPTDGGTISGQFAHFRDLPNVLAAIAS